MEQTLERRTMSVDEFVAKVRIPTPVNGDAYTVAGEVLAAQDPASKSVYGLAMRRSPKDASEFEGVAQDDRMVLYGVTDFIKEHLTEPITCEDINRGEAFMATAHAFGGALNFDRGVWERVVEEYDGYLPIKIESLPEGSTFYPNEIPVQVTSLDDGFGELAAIIEANLVGKVATASARATADRHLLERFLEYAREDMPDAGPEAQLFAAQLMAHDFGMRASSTNEESVLFGKAHLLSFPGTDTFSAAYTAFVENGGERVGSSILAAAHRTIQGAPSEQEAFDNIRKAAGEGGIGSYVADCYDFHVAVREKLAPMALDASKTDGGVIVARPDSGDFVENVLYVARVAEENGLYTTQANGRKAMTNLKFIQGDSMSWPKMKEVMDALKDNGYSPVNCGIFGHGGNARNQATRDALSVAYKLMAKGQALAPEVKLADTRIKMSVPGPVHVLRDIGPNEPSVVMDYEQHAGRNALETMYDGGLDGLARFDHAATLERFGVKQQRTIADFAASPLERTVLSPEIERIQDATLAAHGRNRADYQH